MATATQLMPSPTAGLKSSFSPYTDSPSSPATLAHVFSNRCESPRPPPRRRSANGNPKVVEHLGPSGPPAQPLSVHGRPLASR